MGNLKRVKFAMKTDRDLKKLLVRGDYNEILLDLDGDGEADIALQDIDKNGDIDRIALDITGDGNFDLFIDDNDMNGVPDCIFIVKYGEYDEPDKIEQLAAGPELEAELVAINQVIAQAIKQLIEAKAVIVPNLYLDLLDLDTRISKATRLYRAAH